MNRNAAQRSRTPVTMILLKAMIAVALACVLSANTSYGQGQPASALPDLRGMSWMEDDLFLAVHDAKNPSENDRPRASLVWRAVSPVGIRWQPLEIPWPDPAAPANDLESVARIPGTRSVLLVESGDDGSSFQRIFLASLLTPSNALVIEQVVRWPEPVHNVEASAVARLGNDFIFVYAERAEGRPNTQIRWAKMQLNPLSFGAFSSAR